MRRILLGVLFAVSNSGALAADTPFSQSLPRAEFSSAGLDKLTPAELARLDELVREHRAGSAVPLPPATRTASMPRANEQPRSGRTAVQPAPVPAPTAPARGPVPSSVTVAPGTKVEYSAVESRISGDFRGWERGTVLALENGQRWRVEGSGSYVTSPTAGPTVKIVPGMLGTFWMTIEGVRQRVKVAPLESR